MSGHNVFEQLMRESVVPALNGAPHKKITQAEFDHWQTVVSFDLLKGLRYGQSFCNHFGVSDNILYYEFSWLNANDYIKRAYIS